jgi:outer membrane protein OmpU
MKKILFATTALVATAGVASADISLSGSAEMGVVGGDNYDATQFHTDIDVTFNMSGTADNGLTFGASIDLDEADDSGTGGSLAFGATTQGGETIYIAYGGFKLTMGDTDGAFDAAMQEVNYGGSIADDESGHAGYNGNSGLDGYYDGQIATGSYSSGSFTGYLSVEVDDLGNGDPVWGIGAKYSANGVTVGVGTQSANGESVTGLSVGYSANGVSAGLNWSTYNAGCCGGFFDETHVGVGVGYSMNALTLAANYGVYTSDSYDDTDGFGVSVGYDMGGGLSGHLGYGSDDDGNSWSLGLAMSF